MTPGEVYEALQECVDNIDTLQTEELHYHWRTREFKSENWVDDETDNYKSYMKAKEYIRKAMLELEETF